MRRSFVREILESINEETISFAGGLPDEDLFPIQEIKEIVNKSSNLKSSLQYANSRGLKTLREKIADKLTKEGLPTSVDEIVITSGAQQALYLVSKVFLKEGVAVESPSYLGALGAFLNNRVPIEPVALEPDGISLEGLDIAMGLTKSLYLMSDFQNPSSICYSLDKRLGVAKIIDESNGLLIEDSAYSDLYFDERMGYISSFLPSSSILIGSFSKIFAPGLRVGWIRGAKKYVDKLLIAKESMDLHSSTLSQFIIDRFWEGNDLESHSDSIRKRYKEKFELFCAIAREKLPSFSFEMPRGGMFVYGRFEGLDTKELVQNCIKAGVVFVPGCEFYLGRLVCDEARFNFTSSNIGMMNEGLARIAYIADKMAKKDRRAEIDKAYCYV